MNRREVAPGAFVQAVPGEKFKRCKTTVNLVLPNQRETATALAVLPHLLERRCAAIPNPTALSRKLFALYGAEVQAESYAAGANRVVSIGISGLKNEYALEGEDLATEYLDLLFALLFAPVVEDGAFAAEDVAIETAKQADFLRSEMNDKRSYCIRQARRKLLGTSPLGVESAGYLEDIEKLTPAGLYDTYQTLLRSAAVEVVCCGLDEELVAQKLAGHLAGISRTPQPWAPPQAAVWREGFSHHAEAMDTVQGKLCILLTGPGEVADARTEAVMRLAGALYGGLPTSRLFVNVREKQSLCYYCAASYGNFTGVLSVDSGVDHANAQKASKAILHELNVLQTEPVTEEELVNAKAALTSVFSSAKDNPDALVNWVFSERLRGSNRTLDQTAALAQQVTALEVRDALAAFKPAVEYVITGKGEAQ